MNFWKKATRAGSEEGRLFSQAMETAFTPEQVLCF